MLLEIYVSRPRHIKVWVFGDFHGIIIHMFERDCSLPWRHQKLVEEVPAAGLSDEPLEQAQIKISGHASDARLYAENPENGFLPSTGELTHLRMPDDNVRIDSGVE